MESDHILLVLIGAGALCATFCLMRFPHTRRRPFQRYGPFSLIASFVGALAIFFISALAVYVQAVRH